MLKIGRNLLFGCGDGNSLSLSVFGSLLNVQRYRFASTSATASSAAKMQMIKSEKVGERKNVGLITLDRPKALNALCDRLMQELSDTLVNFDNDSSVGAVVITGSKRAFAAGADIRELHDTRFAKALSGQMLQSWTQVSRMRKPIIAAVNGHALGGGCELAMMCDIIYAGENAKFGQPEITIGTIPGAGGTQRWTRVAGKSLSMEVCLTGKPITAQEAKECGLVARVFPVDQVVTEAIKTAEKISEHSPLIVSLVKDAINRSYETFLQEGLRYESALFHSTFATKDQKEGMAAFLEKRKPEWTSS